MLPVSALRPVLLGLVVKEEGQCCAMEEVPSLDPFLPPQTLLCSVPGLWVRRLDYANEITCRDNQGTGVKQCTPMCAVSGEP